ncbi:hypothetical protein, partial [Burkholderia sp. BCC1998]|uniref:hypothetical protein n=1 Tax=Burkholderia sp. BCC1998 TaxID=2817447 RepID=UPI002AB6716E
CSAEMCNHRRALAAAQASKQASKQASWLAGWLAGWLVGRDFHVRRAPCREWTSGSTPLLPVTPRQGRPVLHRSQRESLIGAELFEQMAAH